MGLDGVAIGHAGDEVDGRCHRVGSFDGGAFGDLVGMVAEAVDEVAR